MSLRTDTVRRRKNPWSWALLMFLTMAIAAGPSCVSLGGTRHIATVTVVSAHATLAAIQDVETEVVCGRPNAMAAPNCIPIEKHHELSGLLASAFDYEIQVAQLVRAVPAGEPQPAELGELLVRIGALVARVMDDLPKHDPKVQSLKANLGGR